MAQKAGTIRGNALCGLNERMCINVRKIFDGCITRYSDREFTLTFDDDELAGDPPFTYVETRSSGPSTVTNLVITPLSGNRNRIQMDVVTPVTVTYTDVTATPLLQPLLLRYRGTLFSTCPRIRSARMLSR